MEQIQIDSAYAAHGYFISPEVVNSSNLPNWRDTRQSFLYDTPSIASKMDNINLIGYADYDDQNPYGIQGGASLKPSKEAGFKAVQTPLMTSTVSNSSIFDNSIHSQEVQDSNKFVGCEFASEVHYEPHTAPIWYTGPTYVEDLYSEANQKVFELICNHKKYLQLSFNYPALPEPVRSDLNIDPLLDKLLITPRDLATDAADPIIRCFANSLENLKLWYYTEQNNITLVCKQFVTWLVNSLHAPLQLNLITTEDAKSKCALMASRFDNIRLKLFHFITSTITKLYDVYGLYNRKRRQLPTAATAILRKWLESHVDHPYPTDAEKIELARLSSLSQVQINTWFGNKRIRDQRFNPVRKGRLSASTTGDYSPTPLCMDYPEDDQSHHLSDLSPDSMSSIENPTVPKKLCCLK